MSDGRRVERARREFRRPPQLAQVVGSILVALAIAAIAVAVVTAKFGSTPVAELEAREERIDAREEREKAREDRREERQEAAEDARQGGGDNRGPG